MNMRQNTISTKMQTTYARTTDTIHLRWTIKQDVFKTILDKLKTNHLKLNKLPRVLFFPIFSK